MIIGIIVGALLWLLLELNKAVKKEEFSFKKFLKINTIPAVTNLFCGLAILWMEDDIKEHIIITKYSSVMIGMFGQAFLKKLTSVFDKNIGTHIGINKSS